ncbi:MAG: hypothetical protein C0594_14455, partial [Marinilabiliales bacterium]
MIIDTLYRILVRQIFLLLILLVSLSASAQEVNCLVKNRKAEKLYNDALELLYSGRRKPAFDKLYEALKVEPNYVEALYELAN